MKPKRYVIPVFVPHLGCPQNCVFCNQRRISGSEEPATAETVRRAIEESGRISPPGVHRELAFYGGSFTAIDRKKQEELLSAAAEFVEAGNSVRLSTRPDCIDEGILKMLRSYGVETVELGSQSMCDDVLLKSGRGHTAEDTERASELIRGYGFSLILQMMTGLPGDTREKAIYTAEKIAACRPDGVRIYPTVVVRDTPLYDMWLRGEYKEHTVAEAADWCSAIVPYFESRGIEIIRLGLNPSEELSGGDAAAGAYHPAFGQIVRSKIMLDSISACLSGETRGKCAVIGVSRGDVSTAVGQKRENIKKLEEKFGLTDVRVVETEGLRRGEFKIISIEKQQ